MHQKRKSCILKSLMVLLRESQFRSTDGRPHQETNMSIGRSICMHDLAKMVIVETSIKTQLMTTDSLSASALVRRVFPLASCFLQARHQSQWLIALMSTTAHKPP